MEIVTFAVVLLLAGIGGGALAAFIGYQTDPKNKFNSRKFVNAVLRGTVAGFGLGMGQVVALQAMGIDDVPGLVVIIEVGTLIAGALGVDFASNRAGDAINKENNSRIKALEEAVKGPTADEPPPDQPQ